MVEEFTLPHLLPFKLDYQASVDDSQSALLQFV